MKMSMIRIVIYWLIVVGLLRFELHNFSLFETLHSASQVIIIKHTRDGQKSVSKDTCSETFQFLIDCFISLLWFLSQSYLK